MNLMKMLKSLNLMKSMKFMKKMDASLFLLYTVFALSILYIGHLLYISDDESLFIFICMSFIIHMSGGNMLYVLLIPLVFVNILKMLKSSYQQESFALLANEKSNIEERVFLVKWMQQNMVDFPDYEQFNSSIDESEKLTPLSTLINNILNLDVETIHIQDIDATVTDLLKYIQYISTLEEDELEQHDNEIKFLERMYAQISADYLNSKDKKEYSIIEKIHTEEVTDDSTTKINEEDNENNKED